MSPREILRKFFSVFCPALVNVFVFLVFVVGACGEDSEGKLNRRDANTTELSVDSVKV